jgi:hypothetical protein
LKPFERKGFRRSALLCPYQHFGYFQQEGKNKDALNASPFHLLYFGGYFHRHIYLYAEDARCLGG